MSTAEATVDDTVLVTTVHGKGATRAATVLALLAVDTAHVDRRARLRHGLAADLGRRWAVQGSNLRPPPCKGG